MVTLKKGEDLPSADPNGYSDPYIKFKLHGDSKKSTVKRFTLNPAWNEKFEWFKVGHSPVSNSLFDVAQLTLKHHQMLESLCSSFVQPA